MEKIRRLDIDLIKGMSILVVVMYHSGLLSTGYLGVDAFFVINGFLIIPSLFLKEMNGAGYFKWLAKRTIRLLPLLLIASVVTLLVGLIAMLPDDYENLSQSVIASNLFSNNILQAITTKNYWDVVNDFKPLMHTWYLGILMQFYIIYPLIVILINKIAGEKKYKWNIILLFLLCVSSLILYLLPSISDGNRFYLLPSRFYEIGIGGLVGCYIQKGKRINSDVWIHILLFGLCLVFFSGWFLSSNSVAYSPVSGTISGSDLLIPKQIILLLTVVLTTFLLICNQEASLYSKLISRVKPLCVFGTMSFSVFLWHQIILAFTRCYIGTINLYFLFVITIFMTLLLSFISYRFIEQRILYSTRNLVLMLAVWILVMVPSFVIYLRAGIIRDVPELGIVKEEAKRGMFAEYNDRVYQLDKDFPDTNNNRLNVLVEGYSFGRDVANILLESEYTDRINISYVFTFEEEYTSRYRKADVIFAFCSYKELPSYVLNSIKTNCKLVGVGPKNYGTNNSAIYIKRGTENYFNSSVFIDQAFDILNEQWKIEWGKNYIDMLSVVKNADGSVRVFTDDNKFISQDCRHLTPYGARFYAKKLPWGDILFN